jgi:negative regulator of sigma E activity
MDRLVARALSRSSDVDYVAQTITTTDYNGKAIKAQATVFHQGGNEKVEYVNTDGKIIWSMIKGDNSYTFLSNEKKLLISETSRLLSNADRNVLLAKNYRLESDGTDRIAGRDAYVVRLLSRYDGRPSKKLWIDKQHLNILKSVDYSASGKERGRTETKKISYKTKIHPNTFDIPVGRSIKTATVCKSGHSMDLFSEIGFPVNSPGYLPAGYKLEGYHLFYSQCNCHHCSAQLTYTDGLNVISIFQSPKITCCTDKSCSMANCGNDKGCAVSDCNIARTGQITKEEKVIVVVGDLLPNDVKKIAESVE